MKVKLIIPRNVYIKTMYWIDKSDKEISGIGKIAIDKEKGEITVVDSYLFPQENGPAETELDAAGLAKGIDNLLVSGAVKEINELRWWWHSHVNMGVFWSGTDHATMRQLGEHGGFFSTVLNKKREKKSAFFIKNGYSLPWGNEEVFLDDIQTDIIDFVNPDLFKEWDEEYKANVKEKTFNYGGQYQNPTIPISGKIMAHTGGKGISRKMRKKLKRQTSFENPYEDRFSPDEYSRLRVCSYSDDDITLLTWLNDLTNDEIIEMAEKGATPEKICQLNYAQWGDYTDSQERFNR